MIKQEALLTFAKKYADPLRIKYRKELEDYIERNYDGILADIETAFDGLFTALNKTDKEVYVIIVAALRTSLKLGKNMCLLTAYDKSWYLDLNPVEAFYNAGWLFDRLHTYAAELNLEKKRFVGKVNGMDIEKIILSELDAYIPYLIILMRKAVQRLLALNSYRQLRKNEVFQIRVGEYMDATESVYIIDNSLKNEEDVKIDLEKIYDHGYMYRHYQRIQIESGCYTSINLSYSRFDSVDLQDSLLDNAVLIGVQFIGCDLQNTNISYSSVFLAEFSDCDIRNANLSFLNVNLELQAVKIDAKMFTRTVFVNCCLKKTDFSYSNLKGFRFINCDLTGSDFTSACLDSVEFVNCEGDIKVSDVQGSDFI